MTDTLTSAQSSIRYLYPTAQHALAQNLACTRGHLFLGDSGVHNLDLNLHQTDRDPLLQRESHPAGRNRSHTITSTMSPVRTIKSSRHSPCSSKYPSSSSSSPSLSNNRSSHSNSTPSIPHIWQGIIVSTLSEIGNSVRKYRRKTKDPIGKAVFYPAPPILGSQPSVQSTLDPGVELSMARRARAASRPSSHPSCMPTPSPTPPRTTNSASSPRTPSPLPYSQHRPAQCPESPLDPFLHLPSTPPLAPSNALAGPSHAFHVVDYTSTAHGREITMPVDPTDSPLCRQSDTRYINATEYPFPHQATPHPPSVIDHRPEQMQYTNTTITETPSQQLSSMVAGWALSTPTTIPPQGRSALGLYMGPPADCTPPDADIRSPTGPSGMLPPAIADDRGYVSPSAGTHSMAYDYKAEANGQGMLTPFTPSSMQLGFTTSSFTPPSQSPGAVPSSHRQMMEQHGSAQISPRPIPFRQPSWTESHRDQSPFVDGSPSYTQAQGLASPATMRQPVRLPIASRQDLSYDIFSPGYSMNIDPQLFNSSANDSMRRTCQPLDQDLGALRSEVADTATVPPLPSSLSDNVNTSQREPSGTIASQWLIDHTLPPEFEQQYTLGDELGSGGYGFVCAAYNTGWLNSSLRGKEVAVKFIFKQMMEDSSDAIIQGQPVESYVLRMCDHPSVINFLDLFEDNLFFIMVQELHGDPWDHKHTLEVKPSAEESFTDPARPVSSFLASPYSPMNGVPEHPFEWDQMSPGPQGDVRPRMGRRASHDLFEAVEAVEFTEHEARGIFQQIVSAVHYLHSKGIYHRDLKDENIVIDRNLKVKIIDFGSAVLEDKLHQPTLYEAFRGTKSYASPEVFQGHYYRAAPCDIWSLGIILAILLTGEQPFATRSDAVEQRYRDRRQYSEMAKDLMDRILTANPDERWTIFKIARHPWLNPSSDYAIPPRVKQITSASAPLHATGATSDHSVEKSDDLISLFPQGVQQGTGMNVVTPPQTRTPASQWAISAQKQAEAARANAAASRSAASTQATSHSSNNAPPAWQHAMPRSLDGKVLVPPSHDDGKGTNDATSVIGIVTGTARRAVARKQSLSQSIDPEHIATLAASHPA